jgi:hypothetical protein
MALFVGSTVRALRERASELIDEMVQGKKLAHVSKESAPWESVLITSVVAQIPRSCLMAKCYFRTHFTKTANTIGNVCLARQNLATSQFFHVAGGSGFVPTLRDASYVVLLSCSPAAVALSRSSI